MNPLLLFVIGTIFAAMHGVSLVAKSETIRGAGRIILGFAFVALGAAGVKTVHSYSLPALLVACNYVLVVVGLMTVGSGMHKYRRRNVAQ